MQSSDLLAQRMLAQCQWPTLASPYAEALQEAVRFILARFNDTLGIIASGTILRGNPAPSSDLDIYVIRERPVRQRIQKFFNRTSKTRGVPTEIFVNPASQVLKYFTEEHEAGRPLTAHMLATGFTILQVSPVVSDLQQRARERLTHLPQLDTERLTTMRYMAAARYEDGTDVAETDPETAIMILSVAVHDMLTYYFLNAGRYVPRDKDLLGVLGDMDGALAGLVRAFFGAQEIDRRLALAEQIADYTIETHGFFEWESTPEEVA
jgi:hypothetical protein